MNDTTDRCPLCGGIRGAQSTDGACDLPQCGLHRHLWPRVAELVAIRNAAVEWIKVVMLPITWSDPRKYRAHIENTKRLEDLARQEAENVRPRTDAEMPED